MKKVMKETRFATNGRTTEHEEIYEGNKATAENEEIHEGDTVTTNTDTHPKIKRIVKETRLTKNTDAPTNI